MQETGGTLPASLHYGANVTADGEVHFRYTVYAKILVTENLCHERKKQYQTANKLYHELIYHYGIMSLLR